MNDENKKNIANSQDILDHVIGWPLKKKLLAVLLILLACVLIIVIGVIICVICSAIENRGGKTMLEFGDEKVMKSQFKFTIPRNADGLIRKKYNEAEKYCRDNFKQGRLARSKNMEDFKDLCSRKSFLNNVMKASGELTEEEIYIGMELDQDKKKVSTLEGDFVGLFGDFEDLYDSRGFRDGDDQVYAVITEEYKLINDKDTSSAFICQHL